MYFLKLVGNSFWKPLNQNKLDTFSVILSAFSYVDITGTKIPDRNHLWEGRFILTVSVLGHHGRRRKGRGILIRDGTMCGRSCSHGHWLEGRGNRNWGKDSKLQLVTSPPKASLIPQIAPPAEDKGSKCVETFSIHTTKLPSWKESVLRWKFKTFLLVC